MIASAVAVCLTDENTGLTESDLDELIDWWLPQQ